MESCIAQEKRVSSDETRREKTSLLMLSPWEGDNLLILEKAPFSMDGMDGTEGDGARISNKWRVEFSNELKWLK